MPFRRVTLRPDDSAQQETRRRRLRAGHAVRGDARPRSRHPCARAEVPEALFESELFGHEKGAFTGATDRQRGKLEAADGGTLFLDEVTDENRKFMRVGGTTKIRVDARLVCATLRALEDEVKAGRFRPDLLYRLQGSTLRVPALRERSADIAPLVQQFTAEIAARHGTKPPRYTRSAMIALRAYAWPGNVRELRDVVELVCLLREGKAVRVRDLPEAASETITLRLDRPLEESVDSILAAALALEDGNRSRAARRLGVSLRTMQRFAGRHARRRTAA